MTHLGMNLASAEFGIPDMEHGGIHAGVYGKDYTYPTHAELDAVAVAGLNIVRIPFSWERMQPSPKRPLDPAQLAHMDDLVAYAARRGITVILDPHNYGYGYGHLIGSPGTPTNVFADLWRRLAAHYRHHRNIVFGLMNEPHDQTPAQWLAPANAAITAIRSTGARQEILVPGTYHTNGAAWVRQGVAAEFADKIVDPANNFAFEVHQYNDGDQSGGSTIPASPTIGAERLADVTAWAESHHKRLFLGEFGAGPDAPSLLAMTNQLAFMQAHANVWQGGTAWAGGPMWPQGNPWAMDAVDGVLSPQTRALQAFVPSAINP
ncbi:glycoside hydrolase family 5 protein [Acidisphaera sp. L21]|uniref:glycoside hydrolase family 5 protein n=1 Tax=Acidisphaera sp. L21 TaxID=1641851 RepID=UPI00131E076B|nr:glycoside hydrolase family 5 protein [Acidisphaera sp. L21]